MIRTIIFDIGGVIIDLSLVKKKMLKLVNPIDENKFWEETSLMGHDLSNGSINITEFCKRISDKYSNKNTSKELIDIWSTNFKNLISLKKDTSDLIKKLKPNYKLGIISNIIEEHVKQACHYDVFNLFDKKIYSYEIGHAKGSLEIYKHALNDLNSKPEETIFIDDVKSFVNEAKSIRINAILFTNTEQLIKDLRKLNVKI